MTLYALTRVDHADFFVSVDVLRIMHINKRLSA